MSELTPGKKGHLNRALYLLTASKLVDRSSSVLSFRPAPFRPCRKGWKFSFESSQSGCSTSGSVIAPAVDEVVVGCEDAGAGRQGNDVLRWGATAFPGLSRVRSTRATPARCWITWGMSNGFRCGRCMQLEGILQYENTDCSPRIPSWLQIATGLWLWALEPAPDRPKTAQTLTNYSPYLSDQDPRCLVKPMPPV